MTSSKPPTEDTEPQEPPAHCKCATEAEIITHIESIITSLIIAVNARNFDPSLPPWTSVSPTFTFPGIGFRQKATTRFDYVEGFRKVAAGYPQFQIEALKMESYVLLAAGYAEVHLTAESFGGPTLSRGMKRSTVGRHEFRRVKGVWVMVSEMTFLGFGDFGSGGEM